MRTYLGGRLVEIPQAGQFSEDYRNDIRVVSSVLPFKVNDYVLQQLIDWTAVPDDPIFRLTFPHRDMLPRGVFDAIDDLLKNGASAETVRNSTSAWRQSLNPHPSGQTSHNVPNLDGRQLDGIQHKYDQTVLVFPSNGQSCHAYCSYCFRWAQFVGESELLFKLSTPNDMVEYLSSKPDVTDVLLTGGDPLIMSTTMLRRWVEPLLQARLEHVRTIRFGTKAIAYWPYRITQSPDGDELLRLLDAVLASGRRVAMMLHVSHPRELQTDVARQAISKLRACGATLYAQAPIIKHVNDDAATWAEMWDLMVSLGIQPYYAFIERDTGANAYFELPIADALSIYRDAQARVSGLARTARGPVMSAFPGKIVIDGETSIGADRYFQLRLIQARVPRLVGKIFFAQFSDSATWIDDLRPAFQPSWPWEESMAKREFASPLQGVAP